MGIVAGNVAFDGHAPAPTLIAEAMTAVCGFLMSVAMSATDTLAGGIGSPSLPRYCPG